MFCHLVVGGWYCSGEQENRFILLLRHRMKEQVELMRSSFNLQQVNNEMCSITFELQDQLHFLV